MPTKAYSKIGPKDVGKSLKGQSSPSNTVPGNPGKSMPAKPIPGAAKPGMPISEKKALAKKPIKGAMTGFPGLVR